MLKINMVYGFYFCFAPSHEESSLSINDVRAEGIERFMFTR